MIFLKTVILVVYFSCSVSSDISPIPRLPYPIFDETGEFEWNITPRIVNGSPAFLGEFMGKISLQTLAGSHFCGGVLIDASHVLTAAHCVTTEYGAVRNPNFFSLMGNDVNLNPASVNRQTRTVTHVFVHPNYNANYLWNDVALLRVITPFQSTATFAPVTRVQITPVAGNQCTVAGWGALYYQGAGSNSLQRVNVNIIDRSICNGANSYNGSVINGMFCAGFMTGAFDACQGDSGGALICGGQVAGIVSWGNQCALANYPGVYTDVAYFSAWINSALAWNDGGHENIPTPTTLNPSPTPTIPSTIPPGSASSFVISLSLIVGNVVLLLGLTMTA